MKKIDLAVTALAASLLFSSFSAFAASHREAPLIGQYHFLLEISGAVMGRFASVEGLGAQIEVVEFREGGETGAIRKIPGRTTYDNIVLKRGYTASDDLWDWIAEIIDDDFVARDGTIQVFSKRSRSVVAVFRIFNAWPSGYRLGVEEADGTDLAIEELTLTVERIEKE